MILPSIDISGGQAVQLIGGEKTAIEAGDPIPIAKRFALAGEIAVIDLDAARGIGDNTPIIQKLLRDFPCRMGGGIRNRESAIKWLDAGATQIILGTAAEPKLLSTLPKERVIAALDAKHGEVVVEGWQKGTGHKVLDKIQELRDYVGGFLVTMVEREGRMKGIDMDHVKQVVEAAGGVKVTVAGGVTTPEEIAEIDRLGADVQVGMALYSGKLDLADGILAPIKTDRSDGLFATVIVDELGHALGLAWSDMESAREAINTQRGAYHSRSRGLWVKGLTSGNTQELLRVSLDCDRDAMRFVVKQGGKGFCHNDTWSCWDENWGLARLLRTLEDRVESSPEGSYTKRLLDDPALLKAKLVEEAGELADAGDKESTIQEAADLFYFALTAMAKAGVGLPAVEAELRRRSLKVTRQGGDAK
jgi:phosphoribosyl-ATP pyrophosphohydrolase